MANSMKAPQQASKAELKVRTDQTVRWVSLTCPLQEAEDIANAELRNVAVGVVALYLGM